MGKERKEKREKKNKVLYTKQKQWHIDPEVRFIDACVALGLGVKKRETGEPGERDIGKEVVVEVDKRHGEKGKENKETMKTVPHIQRKHEHELTDSTRLNGHVLHLSKDLRIHNTR
jgi:hypothetical protein